MRIDRPVCRDRARRVHHASACLLWAANTGRVGDIDVQAPGPSPAAIWSLAPGTVSHRLRAIGHPRVKALPRPCETVTIVPTMDPEVKKVLQAMSPAQKLRAAERLYHSARQLKAAALRAEHPDWTEEVIRQAVREIFLYARS